MNPVDAQVFDCPHCGAVLKPAKDGDRVTCSFCHEETTIDYAGGALVREKASRAEAEKLFAAIGSPPSWTQKVAAFLVHPMLWVVGLPFMFVLLLRVSRIPVALLEIAWEKRTHERLRHVLPPSQSYLLGVGLLVITPIALLIWSLFGERVSAKRDLQAALGAKPPSSKGGKASCRSCGAPLDFEPSALGARCTHCGADNLVKIPPAWAARAKKIDAGLRVNMKLAQSRMQESRRRVLRAALWRVPLVLGLIALVVVPGLRARGNVGWRDMKYDEAKRVGVYVLAEWHSHAAPTTSLQTFRSCADLEARPNLASDSRLPLSASGFCGQDGFDGCQTDASFPLTRGDTLRLTWKVTGSVHAQVALGDRDLGNGAPHFGPTFGDEVSSSDLSIARTGSVALEVPIAISGWYRVDLRGAKDAALDACVAPR